MKKNKHKNKTSQIIILLNACFILLIVAFLFILFFKAYDFLFAILIAFMAYVIIIFPYGILYLVKDKKKNKEE